MSDDTIPTPPADTTPATTPPAAKPKKKRRTWRQRFRILVLLLLIAICVFRVALNVLLPTVINKVAGLYDLEVGYDRLSISLLGGSTQIWGLKARQIGSPGSLLQGEYVYADLSPLNLFRGRLLVYRAEVDNLILSIDREADGSIPVLQKFLAAQNTKPAPPAPPAAGPVKPISLDAPLSIEAIRLSHVTAKLRDKSVTPAFQTTLLTTIRISDVGLDNAPLRFELDVSDIGGTPVLDTLRVTGEARTAKDNVKADLKVLMRGLHPKQAAGYLSAVGIRPVADEINASADLTLVAKTIPNSADFSADIAVTNVSAVADTVEFASLKSMNVVATRLSPAAAEIASISIDGGRVLAGRDGRGIVNAAGLALDPSVTPSAPATKPASLSTTPVAAPTGPAFRLALGVLDVRNCEAAISDKAVTPAADWVAKLDSLSIKNIDTDPARATTPVPLDVVASLPGLVRQATVTGKLTPFAPTKNVELAVRADGIKPDLLTPYLEAFGVKTLLTDGRFTADVSATASIDATAIAAGVRATNVRFTDGDTPLIELNSAVIDRASYALADGAIAVASIDVSGPSLRIIRDTDGYPAAFGFKYVGVSTNVAPTVVAVPTPTPASEASTKAHAAPPPLKLPRIQLDQLTWRDFKLTLEDRDPATPETFTVENAGVYLEKFLLDLDADAAGSGGKFVAWLASPGLADALKAEGSFAPGPNRLTVIANVDGSGFSGTKIAPYLTPFGIVPTLSAGRLSAKASGTLSQPPGSPIDVSIEAHDVTYADGDVELAGVDFANVNGLLLGGTRIDADAINVIKPRARVAREADGTLAAGGVRLVAAPPSTQPTAVVAVASTQPAEPAPLRLPALPIDVGVKALRLIDGELTWSDAAAASPVTVHAVASAALDGIDTAVATPAKLLATARIDGLVGNARVEGTLGLLPASPHFTLMIKADGLMTDGGEKIFAAYVPATFAPTLRDGTFMALIDANVRNHPVSGVAARFRVSDLDYNTAGGRALAKVGGFALDVARVDPDNGIFDIAELSSNGVEAAVTQSPAGLEAAGIRVVANPPAVAKPATTAPAEAPVLSPVASLSSMVADARRPLPALSLGKLDLGLTRLTLSGFTGEKAADIVVRDVRLTSPTAFTLGGRDAENLPDLKLAVEGGIDPLINRFDVGVAVTPFASEPKVAIDVSASGIRGDGLTKIMPDLAKRLDGSALKDGRFTTHVDASINYGRKGPRDLDIGRGFTAAFDVKPLEFRAEPNGPVLAGVGLVHGEGIRVEPKNGNVMVKMVEVATPVFRAYRDDRGINALGLTLLLGRDETPETLTTPASEPAETPAPPKDAAPAERPTNEMRLDRFTVSGADIVIEDRTGKPYTVVPVTGLDIDVQNLSTQLPWNGKSVRFSVLATSDKVAMPPRKGTKGVPTSNPATGEEYTEQRELFSQVSASGKVGFVRQGDAVTLDGWAKTAVNGFELLGVRGLAKQYGVTIGGGAFDDTNDVRFNPAGLIETKNKIVFTNLSLSEPEDGPIRRLLKLPAPIDVAIGAITDPDGSITMNVPVPVKNGAINPSDVAGPALGAVANVLITGIASAPLKAVSGVGNLLGFGNKDVAPEPPVVVNFLPAYASLNAEATAALARLTEELKKDDTLELQVKHTLTDADVARASVRANPSRETAVAMAAQLRRQKGNLLERYASLSAQARGAFGAQANASAARTAEQLRETGRQIAQAEQSLDDLYALTAPNAAAQTERRTRAAALQTGRDRLDAVRAALVAGQPQSVQTRVSLMNPQFDPIAGDTGGGVTITLVRKKR